MTKFFSIITLMLICLDINSLLFNGNFEVTSYGFKCKFKLGLHRIMKSYEGTIDHVNLAIYPVDEAEGMNSNCEYTENHYPKGENVDCLQTCKNVAHNYLNSIINRTNESIYLLAKLEYDKNLFDEKIKDKKFNNIYAYVEKDFKNFLEIDRNVKLDENRDIPQGTCPCVYTKQSRVKRLTTYLSAKDDTWREILPKSVFPK